MTLNGTTTTTLTKDYLNNLRNDDDYDLADPDLLLHYICKTLLRGNVACPFGDSMKKVLDIGYGSGHWMMEMATEFPKCQFYGIDCEPRSPDYVYPVNCSFLEGTYANLPFEDGVFDMIHIRMTLFTLPRDQILALFGEIRRTIRVGGVIEFLEPDLSASAQKENNNPLLNKIASSFVGSVGDEKFYDTMLTEHGFVNIKNDRISVPMEGEFSLAALKLFIDAHSSDEDQMMLDTLDTLGQSSSISVLSGFAFAQKS